MSALLKIKVCGNREAENMKEVCKLKPEYVGFIFYKNSKRFVVSPDILQNDCSAKRVGVFVNATIEEIKSKVDLYDLDYIQLHGDETPDLKKKTNQIRPVFKAFQIDNNFNFNKLNYYLSACYMFLFDTTSKSYGGSGQKFDWRLLSKYKASVPFLLSGGIGPEDAVAIKALRHPMLAGIDVNSRFEDSPGVKNIELLSEFIKQIKE